MNVDNDPLEVSSRSRDSVSLHTPENVCVDREPNGLGSQPNSHASKDVRAGDTALFLRDDLPDHPNSRAQVL